MEPKTIPTTAPADNPPSGADVGFDVGAVVGNADGAGVVNVAVGTIAVADAVVGDADDVPYFVPFSRLDNLALNLSNRSI